jgi:hypothetical protein
MFLKPRRPKNLWFKPAGKIRFDQREPYEINATLGDLHCRTKSKRGDNPHFREEEKRGRYRSFCRRLTNVGLVEEMDLKI